MFKALNLQTNAEVIILSPVWTRQLQLLRSLDRQDLLACPTCQQPVRVRAGRYKRRHFAHKHLENCPYQRESPLLLDCRALLYEWLVSQFGTERVNLEVSLELPGLKRPVDCYVSTDTGQVAFWIIERRLPPRERELLKGAFEKTKTMVHWIFVSGMLHTDRILERVFLTTTEREFMSHSRYDETYLPSATYPGASLHFLDNERKEFITHRGLRLVHPPQLYQGHIERHPLSLVKASPLNGEPIHPGEVERLASSQEQRLLHEKMVQDASSRFQGRYPRHVVQDPGQEIEPAPTPANDPFTQREAICMFCGEKTDNWWYLNPVDGKCKCRECLRKGIA